MLVWYLMEPLVAQQNKFHLTGRAEWLDKSHRKCLLLWHRIQDWADLIISFVSIAQLKAAVNLSPVFALCMNLFVTFYQVKDNGLEDSVMTVEEIRSGVESRGTGKFWALKLITVYVFNISLWELYWFVFVVSAWQGQGGRAWVGWKC